MKHLSDACAKPASRGGLRALLHCLTIAAALAATGGAALADSSGGVPEPVAPRVMSSVANADAAAARRSNIKWRSERPSDLAERWYHWFESIPADAVPNGDPSGANCGIGQSGPLWFLSGPLGKTYVYACTIPAGKVIMSPVFNVIDDYPCPLEFKFEPSPGQSLEDFLEADIAHYVNLDYTTATLDGVALRVDGVRTPLFAFAAATSNIASDPCITGSPQRRIHSGRHGSAGGSFQIQ